MRDFHNPHLVKLVNLALTHVLFRSVYNDVASMSFFNAGSDQSRPSDLDSDWINPVQRKQVSAAADRPARRGASRLPCCTQLWTVSVINW